MSLLTFKLLSSWLWSKRPKGPRKVMLPSRLSQCLNVFRLSSSRPSITFIPSIPCLPAGAEFKDLEINHGRLILIYAFATPCVSLGPFIVLPPSLRRRCFFEFAFSSSLSFLSELSVYINRRPVRHSASRFLHIIPSHSFLRDFPPSICNSQLSPSLLLSASAAPLVCLYSESLGDGSGYPEYGGETNDAQPKTTQ